MSALPAAGAARLPDDDETAQALARARAAMERIPQDTLPSLPSMPKVEAIPKPAAAAPDIATLAARYKELVRGAAPNRRPDLLVLVSLSMPVEALERIVVQAERAGATLVFRGLPGDSMSRMGEEIEKIRRGRNLAVAIHPPAFQQFGVERVPAVVIAAPGADSVLADGCASSDTYVKVTGDVSLDYALDYIERHSVAFTTVAREYHDKIVRFQR